MDRFFNEASGEWFAPNVDRVPFECGARVLVTYFDPNGPHRGADNMTRQTGSVVRVSGDGFGYAEREVLVRLDGFADSHWSDRGQVLDYFGSSLWVLTDAPALELEAAELELEPLAELRSPVLEAGRESARELEAASPVAELALPAPAELEAPAELPAVPVALELEAAELPVVLEALQHRVATWRYLIDGYGMGGTAVPGDCATLEAVIARLELELRRAREATRESARELERRAELEHEAELERAEHQRRDSCGSFELEDDELVYAVTTRLGEDPVFVAELGELRAVMLEGESWEGSLCDACGCGVFTARWHAGRADAGVTDWLELVCEGSAEAADYWTAQGASAEAAEAHRSGCGSRYVPRLVRSSRVVFP